MGKGSYAIPSQDYYTGFINEIERKQKELEVLKTSLETYIEKIKNNAENTLITEDLLKRYEYMLRKISEIQNDINVKASKFERYEV